MQLHHLSGSGTKSDKIVMKFKKPLQQTQPKPRAARQKKKTKETKKPAEQNRSKGRIMTESNHRRLSVSELFTQTLWNNSPLQTNGRSSSRCTAETEASSLESFVPTVDSNDWKWHAITAKGPGCGAVSEDPPGRRSLGLTDDTKKKSFQPLN